MLLAYVERYCTDTLTKIMCRATRQALPKAQASVSGEQARPHIKLTQWTGFVGHLADAVQTRRGWDAPLALSELAEGRHH